ncbi:hypothetical protein LCGC14_1343140 [marine sediment metagenome]|uniref:Holin n=1 Tax=marine sediment metagenome TaxID=412755 RepID=A0A0F9KZH8_9ZZZZ
MPQVLKDLLGSEKGLIAVALIIAVTVLAALDHIPIERWESYTKWIFGFFAVGTGLRAIGQGIGNKREADTLRTQLDDLQSSNDTEA